ncbi:MAG: hypothetical protein OXN89_03655 [Bryobacterales bacterium]|nr:hypothetical protein [Bryobacterales bacterium]
MANITYVPTPQGFVFLGIVLDVLSRKIVCGAMIPRQTVEMVQAALECMWFRGLFEWPVTA